MNVVIKPNMIHSFWCRCAAFNFHFIEKANGIKYLYAWLDKHPDDYVVLFASVLPAWIIRLKGIVALCSRLPIQATPFGVARHIFGLNPKCFEGGRVGKDINEGTGVGQSHQQSWLWCFVGNYSSLIHPAKTKEGLRPSLKSHPILLSN